MPEPPSYLVSLCEGDLCRPLFTIDDASVTVADLLPFLAELAVRLRSKGAMGRVVVTDRESGAVIATRQVWP
jgi:hypothetical protein